MASSKSKSILSGAVLAMLSALAASGAANAVQCRDRDAKPDCMAAEPALAEPPAKAVAGWRWAGDSAAARGDADRPADGVALRGALAPAEARVASSGLGIHGAPSIFATVSQAAQEFPASAREFVGVGAYSIRHDTPGPYGDDFGGGPVAHSAAFGLAAQYHYAFQGQGVSAQLGLSREPQEWSATVPGRPAMAVNRATQNAGSDYQMTYGVLVRYVPLMGAPNLAPDRAERANPAAGPGHLERAGFGWELDFLPRRALRFALQYANRPDLTAVATNYDGLAKIADGNTTVYMLAWLKF